MIEAHAQRRGRDRVRSVRDVLPRRRHADAIRGFVALAGSMGLRLVRHPLFLVGVVLSAAYFRYLLAEVLGSAAVVLHRDDSLVTGGLFPLAMAALVASGVTVLADERRGALGEVIGSVPADRSVRTAARIASLTLPVGVAFVLALGALIWLAQLDAVGSPSLAELATGPLMVGVAGAIGIAVATWLAHPLGPTLVMMAIAAIHWAFQASQNNGVASWLTLWPSRPQLTAAPELLFRPSGRHLVYLGAALLAAGALAVLRHDRRSSVVATAVVFLTATVMAGWWVSMPPGLDAQRAAASLLLAPEKHQRCVSRGVVEACAYPAYRAWAEQWVDMAGTILAPVADALGDRRIVIRQTLGIPASGARVQWLLVSPRLVKAQGTASTIYTSTVWMRPGETGDQLGVVATQVAAWAVGLPGSPSGSPLRSETCSAADQARAAVAVYLVSRSDPLLRDELVSLGRYGTLFVGPAAITLREIRFGQELASRPEVADPIVWAWQRILRPQTTLRDLGTIVNVKPPPVDAAVAESISLRATDPPCD